jgi:hypothetical protein
MAAARLTRRRALELGAAAGAFALLPAAAAPARRGAAARGFAMDVPAFDSLTAVLPAPRRFDLVGVRSARLHGARLEVRVRERGGRWSPWVPLGHGHAHRPDTGRAHQVSDPVWAGGADELQLRGRHRGPLRLQFVAIPAAAKRHGARAVAAAKARAAQGPPPIIPREQWGGDKYPPRAKPTYGEVQVAFVHHTVSANDYAPEDSPGIVQAICKYHRDTNGWNDLGYNFVVDQYGQVFEGRAGGIDQAVVGAQAQGYNSVSTGIATIGTFTDVPLPEAGVQAVANLIAWKLPLHGAPVQGQVVVKSGGGDLNRYPAGTQVRLERISGHRDGDSTACPGNQLYTQLPDIRNRAFALAPTVGPPVRVTLAKPAKDAVTYGDEIALSGEVRRGDGSPVAGQQVLVQKRGAKAWSTIAKATTDAAGAWSATVAWKRAGAIRSRAAVPGAPVAVSPLVSIGLLASLEAKADTTRIRAGRTVRVRGVVRPVGNVRVAVERQVRPGRFAKVGEVAVRPSRAAFDVRVALRKPGLYRLTPRAGARSSAVAAPALFVRAVRAGQPLRPADTGGAAF